MKHNMTFPRLHMTSVRLALTYLAIIMVLSVSFSLIFYRTSTVNLEIRVQPGQNALYVAQEGEVNGMPLNGPINHPQAVDVASLNAQLQKRTHQIKVSLSKRLILLNIGALTAGALFSYYLARRTLHPIEVATDAQARFASDASHELRTPIAALRVRNEVTLRKPNLTITEAREAIKTSIDQAIKLEKLSDGLLRLSRNDTSGIRSDSILVNEMVTEAINHVVVPAQSKHIKIDDTIPDMRVIADADSIIQVITILLDNAIKYSHGGSVVLVEATVEGKYCALHIKDMGAGIRATDLPHIFERFYRADYSRTKQGEQGYGLGLSIARKLIIQNKGRIAVQSVIGEGSTFSIYLPFAKL